MRVQAGDFPFIFKEERYQNKILPLPKTDLTSEMFASFLFKNKVQDRTNQSFFFRHLDLTFSKHIREKALPDIRKPRPYQVMSSHEKHGGFSPGLPAEQLPPSVFHSGEGLLGEGKGPGFASS